MTKDEASAGGFIKAGANVNEITAEQDAQKRIENIKRFIFENPDILDAIRASYNALPTLSTRPYYTININDLTVFTISFLLGEFTDLIAEAEGRGAGEGTYRFEYQGDSITQEDFFNLKLVNTKTTQTTTIRALFEKRGLGRVVKEGLPLERSISFYYVPSRGIIEFKEEQTTDGMPMIEMAFDNDGEFISSTIERSAFFDEFYAAINFGRELLFRLHFHPDEGFYPSITDIENMEKTNSPDIIICISGKGRVWFIADLDYWQKLKESPWYRRFKEGIFTNLQIYRDVIDKFMASVEIDITRHNDTSERIEKFKYAILQYTKQASAQRRVQEKELTAIIEQSGCDFKERIRAYNEIREFAKSHPELYPYPFLFSLEYIKAIDIALYFRRISGKFFKELEAVYKEKMHREWGNSSLYQLVSIHRPTSSMLTLAIDMVDFLKGKRSKKIKTEIKELAQEILTALEASWALFGFFSTEEGLDRFYKVEWGNLDEGLYQNVKDTVPRDFFTAGVIDIFSRCRIEIEKVIEAIKGLEFYFEAEAIPMPRQDSFLAFAECA